MTELRLLFVAHHEKILRQSLEVFRRVICTVDVFNEDLDVPEVAERLSFWPPAIARGRWHP